MNIQNVPPPLEQVLAKKYLRENFFDNTCSDDIKSLVFLNRGNFINKPTFFRVYWFKCSYTFEEQEYILYLKCTHYVKVALGLEPYSTIIVQVFKDGICVEDSKLLVQIKNKLNDMFNCQCHHFCDSENDLFERILEKARDSEINIPLC